MIDLNNLTSQIKSITSKTKLHIYCTNWLRVAHTRKLLLLSLDDLDHIYILLDEGNDLKKEITYLFNEVFLISSLKKKHDQSGPKYIQNMYRNTG